MNNNDRPDYRDVKTFEKLEREWDKKKEKGEEAVKNLDNAIREFFRENRARLAKEALENIHKAPARNPFSHLDKGGEGSFGGKMSSIEGMKRDEDI